MRWFKLTFKSGYTRLAIICDNVNSDFVIKSYLTGMIEKTPESMTDVVVNVEVL